MPILPLVSAAFLFFDVHVPLAHSSHRPVLLCFLGPKFSFLVTLPSMHFFPDLLLGCYPFHRSQISTHPRPYISHLVAPLPSLPRARGVSFLLEPHYERQDV